MNILKRCVRHFRGNGLRVSCFALLLFVASFLAPVTCAAEGHYVITETELTTLQNNLTELQNLNEQSQTELKRLRSELETSKTELAEARKQSTELRKQLDELTAASKRQTQSLDQVNESLKEYAREEKRTRLRIKAQRNAWEAVAACALIAFAAK